MHTDNLVLLFFFLFGYLISPCTGHTQEEFDTYVISVGNGHYEHDFTKFEDGFTGFSDVESAVKSAEDFLDIFRGKSKFYRLIKSDSLNKITMGQIIGAIDEAVSKAKKDNGKPLIIFYYCGHGLAEPYSLTLYLPPGDFVSDINKHGFDQLNSRAISSHEIFDRVGSIPHLIFFDCCSEAHPLKENDLHRYELGGPTVPPYRAQTLVLNESKYGGNCVVLSTERGQTTSTVPHPCQTYRIGPICRRLILATGKGEKRMLPELILQLKHKELDKFTKPVICNWNPNQRSKFFLGTLSKICSDAIK